MQTPMKKIHERFGSPRKIEARHIKRISRHPAFVVPMITFFSLLMLSIVLLLVFNGGSPRIHSSDSRVVIISHDHVEQTVPTREKTVGTLLKKLNIKVNPGDVVEPAQSTAINQDDFRINIYRGTPVEVVDGGNKTFTYSAASTARSIVKQVGLTAYPEDYVTLEPTDNFLSEDAIAQRVVIDRALPVTLNLYGTSLSTRTHAKTVGQLIKEKKIKLAKGDTLQPDASTPLAKAAQVFIVRKGTKIETVTQDIAMPTQTIQDSSLTIGTSAVRQQGSPGKQVLTYQINLENGVEKSRTLIQTVVTQAPVTQITAQGTNLSGIKGDMALAGISASDYNYVDYIVTRESGWCPTKWQGDVGSCPAYHGTPPSYLGYGLCQATPGTKMSTAGSDWATNPITQLKWCSSYATRTYGSWAAAYSHWLAHHSW